MATHKEFTAATDVQVYCCDPQSPWQCGLKENANLLLQQYFPRGTDLAPMIQASKIPAGCGVDRLSWHDKSEVEKVLLLNSSGLRSGCSIRPSEHRDHELGYGFRGAQKLRV